MATAADQLRRLRLGAACTAAITALAWLLWGSAAVTAALVFGALATVIQLFAARTVRRMGVPATPDRLKVYAIGMALRIGGVAVMGVAMTIDRVTFPPGPVALGYLGTLLPLLWLETRLA